MRLLLACSSYWHTAAEAEARFKGVWLQPTDPLTANLAYHLDPAYKGVFGLKAWYSRCRKVFTPVQTYVTCGTWSDPSHSFLGQLVEVVNSGVSPTRPHTNNWQYMGCALTALMAAVCNRRDWDILVFLEPDMLFGALNWDQLLAEFRDRPELVMGPRWYERHCDLLAWKPEAAVRYLHQRLRPNLSDDTSLMWLDDEITRMFQGEAWNPWPEIQSTRQDHPHLASPRIPNEEVMRWPLVRLPDPAIVDRYLAECTALATPVKQA